MTRVVLPPGVAPVENVEAPPDLAPHLLEVSAVIVTRGDVDLRPVYASLSMMGEIVTWNNGTLQVEIANMDGVRQAPATVGWDTTSPPRDLAVYGRYAAMRHCRFQTVYVQDDDCVLASESIYQLRDTFEEGGRRGVAMNVPERFRGVYSDSGLVGFGAVMDVDWPERVFGLFLDAIGDDPFDEGLFLRRADNILTTLSPRTLVDVPYTDLPWASAAGRMWTTPGHVAERDEALRIARVVRDRLAAQQPA